MTDGETEACGEVAAFETTLLQAQGHDEPPAGLREPRCAAHALCHGFGWEFESTRDVEVGKAEEPADALFAQLDPPGQMTPEEAAAFDALPEAPPIDALAALTNDDPFALDTVRPDAPRCCWSTCEAAATHEVKVRAQTGGPATWQPRCHEHRQLEDSTTTLLDLRAYTGESGEAGPLVCPMCAGEGEVPERIAWGVEYGGDPPPWETRRESDEDAAEEGAQALAAVLLRVTGHLDAAVRELQNGVAELRAIGVLTPAATSVATTLAGLLRGQGMGIAVADFGDVLPRGGGV